MAELRWTEEALRWLRDIHDYVAADNPDAAQELASAIYTRIQILRQFPDLGYRYRDEPEGEIRILVYGHYRIAYLRGSLGVLHVLGIFHGALDLEQYLG